jgi:Fic family protein
MRRTEYVHERLGWPDFTFSNDALASLLAAVRHRQGRLLGEMAGLGFDLQNEASLTTLTADVVKSSAIEGEKLNPDEVRSSIAARLGLDAGGLPPAGRDVEGIVEMMLDATQRYDEPLSAERLFGWHAALFPTGRSGMRRITVAGWRAGSMQVVSGRVGNERVHFEAPAAERLPEEMDRFLDWYNRPSPEDPVLRAGIAHLWFVTIHPFDDGNGRIARAIADMALARSDESKSRFYSMSSQIERERKEYYSQLERQQRGELDITPWLAWFLGCLDRAIASATDLLGAVLYKARLWERINQRPVNERQRKIINRMLGDFEGFMNTSKYAKLAKCSNDTALRDILDLVERGILLRNEGGGRSTSYRLAELESVKP